METLPERARRLRIAKGMTIEGLAFAAGLSVASVQRLETAKHEPTDMTLGKLAEALGTTSADLLADEVVS